jgi:hypothetical protein
LIEGLDDLRHNLAQVEVTSSSLVSRSMILFAKIAEFDRGTRELFFRENVTAFQVACGRELRAHARIINDHFAQEL